MENRQDQILQFVVIWMFASRLFWQYMPNLMETYDLMGYFDYLYFPMEIIWGLVPFALASMIQHRGKRHFLMLIATMNFFFDIMNIMDRY